MVLARVENPAQFVNVFGAAHKAQPDPVYVFVQGNLEVRKVFGGQAGQRNTRIGQVYAFFRLEASALNGLGQHLVDPIGRQHLEQKLPVVKQDGFSRLHVARELLVGHVHPLFSALALGCGEGYQIPRLQKSAFFYYPNAEFGTLQVSQNGDVLACFFENFAN